MKILWLFFFEDNACIHFEAVVDPSGDYSVLEVLNENELPLTDKKFLGIITIEEFDLEWKKLQTHQENMKAEIDYRKYLELKEKFANKDVI